MSARVTSHGLEIVNPGDASWTRHRYVLALGAYGWTRLLIWANSLEDAIDTAAGWCETHAPGLLCDDEVREEFGRAQLDGLSDGEAYERATVDTINTGDGHYFHSWEVHLMAEDPSRETLLRIQERR